MPYKYIKLYIYIRNCIFPRSTKNNWIPSQSGPSVSIENNLYHAILFLVWQEFEFRISHLQSSMSDNSSPFYCGYVVDESLTNYSPWLDLNHDPPDLSLPSSSIIGVCHWGLTSILFFMVIFLVTMYLRSRDSAMYFHFSLTVYVILFVSLNILFIIFPWWCGKCRSFIVIARQHSSFIYVHMIYVYRDIHSHYV